MTMTAFDHPNIPDCAGKQATSFCDKQSDDVFHLSPFAWLQEYTICPVYNINNTAQACLNMTLGMQCNNSNSEGGCSSSVAPGDGPKDQSCKVPLEDTFLHVVPPPTSTAEAYLLLKTARANRQVWLTRQNLVHQIVHRNTLTLQYNHLMLEKAQDTLHTADRFMGKVHTTIRQSGVTAAFEYVMREDYSLYAGASGLTLSLHTILPLSPQTTTSNHHRMRIISSRTLHSPPAACNNFMLGTYQTSINATSSTTAARSTISTTTGVTTITSMTTIIPVNGTWHDWQW
ncbi:hypothetical protein SCLCIDRAFT_11597 [Scleroderma citrinum Foug A]|uniref:Uncharacterized protein n=1 Tax=Scleroderma citrinum Foug A TaxID=1036808 RepID=A0A0C3DB90_9AGAM|nr:hypothetical protein SCLCIDRAFT_11597 [Scleroderma citrinum Foug A]